MPAGSAVRNRSGTVTVSTPRGEVEVVRQEMRGQGRRSSWRWSWLAHRRGSGGWSEATTAREAIRRATLLPPRKLPAWLNEAAAQAERKITAVETEDTASSGSTPSESPAGGRVISRASELTGLVERSDRRRDAGAAAALAARLDLLTTVVAPPRRAHPEQPVGQAAQWANHDRHSASVRGRPHHTPGRVVPVRSTPSVSLPQGCD